MLYSHIPNMDRYLKSSEPKHKNTPDDDPIKVEKCRVLRA
jgi:hypothetical protein